MSKHMQGFGRLKLVRIGLLALSLLLVWSVPTFASGGPSGGGGTSGGGSPAPTPTPAPTSMIAYSNFGPVAPLAGGTGYGTVGLQTTGYYNLTADQFVPAVSGALSRIRIPLQQFDTGGNGQFTVSIFADDPSISHAFAWLTGPSPVSNILLASYRGQSAKNGVSTLPVINVSGGLRLIAGQTYWFQVAPSSQSREAWVVNAPGISTVHYYSDPNVTVYSADMQGAFELSVVP